MAAFVFLESLYGSKRYYDEDLETHVSNDPQHHFVSGQIEIYGNFRGVHTS